jgi:hypothetical protein
MRQARSTMSSFAGQKGNLPWPATVTRRTLSNDAGSKGRKLGPSTTHAAEKMGELLVEGSTNVPYLPRPPVGNLIRPYSTRKKEELCQH